MPPSPYALVRPLLFALPAAEAHALGMAALLPLEYVAPLRSVARAVFASPKGLETKRMGLTFPSPVGLAAGFDKNATRARALSSLGFGHIELGTVTALPQDANPAPNLFRLPKDHALINRLGFPNEGAAQVLARLEAHGGARALGVPLGISIGKSRAVPIDPIGPAIDDYLTSFEIVRNAADFVVINVSSPNTKDLRAIQGAELARALLGAIVTANARPGVGKRVPLLVKIAPDLSDADLEALLAVVDEVKLDGVVATNTTIARSGLATDPGKVEAIGAGGLSGAPLRLRALEVVRRVRAHLGPDMTVIGVGGIETGAHALALMDAGADLVQLYTGFIYRGPWAAWAIAREMAKLRG